MQEPRTNAIWGMPSADTAAIFVQNSTKIFVVREDLSLLGKESASTNDKQAYVYILHTRTILVGKQSHNPNNIYKKKLYFKLTYKSEGDL